MQGMFWFSKTFQYRTRSVSLCSCFGESRRLLVGGVCLCSFGVFGQAAGQEGRRWFSSLFPAPCQQPVCTLLSLDKCEVARSTVTDANSNSGFYPAAQVVSGRQLPPGESLPCLILYELAWMAGLRWKPPACSQQTLAGGTWVLAAAGAWTRARSSARQWWQCRVAVLCSRLALSAAAAFCQVLVLKRY